MLAIYTAVTFQVTGTGEFPWTMLLFDKCRPVTGTDMSKILRDGRRTVTIIAYSPVNGDRLAPTPEQWQSFGWTVAPDSIRPVTS